MNVVETILPSDLLLELRRGQVDHATCGLSTANSASVPTVLVTGERARFEPALYQVRAMSPMML
ncbi:hypothetical protein BD309DRAFT_371063 [Dichomitus squalens]|uniref:Uncharacterized protein n=2 Tax=Dichomitus squalens TaxID=114155 RepID=A0A4V2K1E6_9APHY|nr:uncharacterized protein DICSQDRAFT_156267 [Dichomitus squalens LYAD-421 SS1]EJF59597.1 hypothetical protein DICSQDRAFT_156267 [Dichomitus squalens LYAD-421 SS1]TBU32483.1 hypothetical protein BD311DRAFT_541356 [Dichomitus squalens]TBU48048.1 hypothetical protein BD309DRAFT_371063 [Dichomitus squalens]TBU59399.1 hypothetical protein BD310DRAFT_947993 [Dichomitus squalens]